MKGNVCTVKGFLERSCHAVQERHKVTRDLNGFQSLHKSLYSLFKEHTVSMQLHEHDDSLLYDVLAGWANLTPTTAFTVSSNSLLTLHYFTRKCSVRDQRLNRQCTAHLTNILNPDIRMNNEEKTNTNSFLKEKKIPYASKISVSPWSEEVHYFCAFH